MLVQSPAAQRRRTITTFAVAPDGRPMWATDYDPFDIIPVPEDVEDQFAYRLFKAGYIPESILTLGAFEGGMTVDVFRANPEVEAMLYTFLVIVSLDEVAYYIQVAGLNALHHYLALVVPIVRASLATLDTTEAMIDRQVKSTSWKMGKD